MESGLLQRDTAGFFLQLFFVWGKKEKKDITEHRQQEEDYYRFYLSDPLSYEGKTAQITTTKYPEESQLLYYIPQTCSSFC